MPLTSFAPTLHVAVIGASGGIGAALVAALAADVQVVHITAFSRSGKTPARNKVTLGYLDLIDPASITTAAASVATPLDLVIVATGHLIAPERDMRQLDTTALARDFAILATGPALVAQAFLPKLRTDHKSVFAALSARVGSITDNNLGGWYGYRAAKAALNQLLRTLAIEQARKNRFSLVVGLHPGTVDTALSKPFQRGVAPGKLFTPDQSAACLLNVLDALTVTDSGGVFAWDGMRIAP